MENTMDSPAVDIKLQRRRDLQRRSRRKKNLIKKAVQMSILCDAEVYLGIRIKDTGRVTTFCSHPAGIWSSAQLEGYCPVPVRMTLDDFVKKNDSGSEESVSEKGSESGNGEGLANED